MNVVGVTGSVGTGKSTFSKKLAAVWSGEYLSTDAIAARLLAGSHEVQGEIRDAYGAQVFNADGKIDRRLLREMVFESDAALARLGKVLHPRIREEWQDAADRCRSLGNRLVIEIPLLFENQVERDLDCTICVCCSESLQIERLVSGRDLKVDLAKRMIQSQWPLDVKAKSANHLVENQGTLAHLSNQADILAEFFSFFR